MLALPGSAYIYQGEELGLPEVVELPDEARQDPSFRRSNGQDPGRDGCRVPLPWTSSGPAYGFSSGPGSHQPPPSWLPQPGYWGQYSVARQLEDPDSFFTLYRDALNLRRTHPALGFGEGARADGGAPDVTWLDGPDGTLFFRREPGFVFAANTGPETVPLPPHRKVLLASGPIEDGKLPPDTAAWLAG